jgi:hypothetical protein
VLRSPPSLPTWTQLLKLQKGARNEWPAEEALCTSPRNLIEGNGTSALWQDREAVGWEPFLLLYLMPPCVYARTVVLTLEPHKTAERAFHTHERPVSRTLVIRSLGMKSRRTRYRTALPGGFIRFVCDFWSD